MSDEANICSILAPGTATPHQHAWQAARAAELADIARAFRARLFKTTLQLQRCLLVACHSLLQIELLRRAVLLHSIVGVDYTKSRITMSTACYISQRSACIQSYVRVDCLPGV